MKTMIRLLSLLLAIMMVATTFIACGDDEETKTDKHSKEHKNISADSSGHLIEMSEERSYTRLVAINHIKIELGVSDRNSAVNNETEYKNEGIHCTRNKQHSNQSHQRVFAYAVPDRGRNRLDALGGGGLGISTCVKSIGYASDSADNRIDERRYNGSKPISA